MLQVVDGVKTGRREMYAALTRAAIVDAARALFVEHGFAETSVDDIARAAQTSKGAVYHHFPDKRQIFAEVFEAGEISVLSAALEAMPAAGSPFDRLQMATSVFLRSYVSDGAARTLLLQAMEVLGWQRVKAIGEHAALAMVRTGLSELFSGGGREELPIAAAAELVYGLYCNAILFIAEAEDAEQAAADADAVITAMLRGLRPG